MNTVTELEKEVLALPASERERLAMVAWESLFGDPDTAGDPKIDPESIGVASQRDAEIESGHVQPIAHAEFLRRTGDAAG